MLKTVLIPFNASPCAFRSLKYGLFMASEWRLNIEIALLPYGFPHTPRTGHPDSWFKETERAFSKLLDRHLSQGLHQVAHRFIVHKFGAHDYKELAEKMEARKPDLMVSGAETTPFQSPIMFRESQLGPYWVDVPTLVVPKAGKHHQLPQSLLQLSMPQTSVQDESQLRLLSSFMGITPLVIQVHQGTPQANHPQAPLPNTDLDCLLEKAQETLYLTNASGLSRGIQRYLADYQPGAVLLNLPHQESQMLDCSFRYERAVPG